MHARMLSEPMLIPAFGVHRFFEGRNRIVFHA
jgi:hypothetical protein